MQLMMWWNEIQIVDVIEWADVGGLATNSTGCSGRELAKEFALEGHIADEMEWVLEGL